MKIILTDTTDPEAGNFFEQGRIQKQIDVELMIVQLSVPDERLVVAPLNRNHKSGAVTDWLAQVTPEAKEYLLEKRLRSKCQTRKA